mgnify:CR=1 FL=1
MLLNYQDEIQNEDKRRRRAASLISSGSVVIIFMNIREAKEQIEHAVKLYWKRMKKADI